MKLAVVGKGGSGKTTTAAVLARSFARSGKPVVALDCDSNPNLGISLGLGFDETERLLAMRQGLDDGTQEHAPSWDRLVEMFGTDAPDGVRFAVVNAIENPQPGCPCCGLSPEQLLRQGEFGETTVVADFEAGVGTLTRMEGHQVDVVIVVVEPTAKSIDVGVRAAELVRQNALGRLVVLANQLREDGDLARIEAAFADTALPDTALPGTTIVGLSYDEQIVAADRSGLAPLDHDPQAPAVRSLVTLATTLSGPAGTDRAAPTGA